MQDCEPAMDDRTCRLPSSDRRQRLLDAARELLDARGIDAVTMETVAARADVSRALVYKHFANRGDLLSTVYRDEAARLDRTMADAVGAENDLEGALRALVTAVFGSLATHRSMFVALARAGARDDELRQDQRSRDQRTVRFFADLAVRQFALDEADARSAVAIVLSGIESVRLQALRRTSAAQRRQLEDRFVALAIGGLERLAASSD